MDANRYFDAMHNAMSAQHPGAQQLSFLSFLSRPGDFTLRSVPCPLYAFVPISGPH